jgi:hypothetical protein
MVQCFIVGRNGAMNKNSIPLLISGLLIALAVLLLIPSTSQALFSLAGIEPQGKSLVGSSFDAFIPFIPGYFPEDFTITSVRVGMHESPGENIYSEHYASETNFFKIIQSQGRHVEPDIPNPDLTIQGSSASLTSQVDLDALVGDDLERFDISEVWLLTVVMRGIRVQVVSNLPPEEVIRIARELIPQRCTSTPTPQG